MDQGHGREDRRTVHNPRTVPPKTDQRSNMMFLYAALCKTRVHRLHLTMGSMSRL